MALLLTLADGGARVVSTGNLSSTQPDAVAYLRARGIEVIGGPPPTRPSTTGICARCSPRGRDLLLDNGGDLFVRYLGEPYPGLLAGPRRRPPGGCGCGRWRPSSAVPVLVINDSPIKQFAENRHAVGQSVLESYLRITNQMTNGRQVTVFGYGACGKGVAANFRNAHASVAVVEIDPVTRLEASLDGFAVPGRRGAARRRRGDHRDRGRVRDHRGRPGLPEGRRGPAERWPFPPGDRRGRASPARPRWRQRLEAADGITTFRLDRRPANPPADPAATWPTWRARARWAIRSSRWTSASPCRPAAWRPSQRGSLGAGHVVVPVPRFIDELVATSFLDRYGRSGTPPSGSGPRAAGANGAGGFADDEDTGQHLAGRRAPGPDVPA